MSTDVCCVPRTLAAYIATRERGASSPLARCTGCLDHPAIASDGTNDYCLPCWTSQHAYDQAEEKVARAILGAAVSSALEAGVSENLVRQVVEDAMLKVTA